MKRNKGILQIGPCSPALDDWGWKMREYIDDFRAKNPDSPKTDEELRSEFEATNPYPKPQTIVIPSLGDKIKKLMKGKEK